MRYDPLSAELYRENRRRLTALLPRKSLVVVHSNDIMPTNADGSMGFHQSTDLLHLSGIDQEDTVLVLFPFAYNPAHREILFLRETSELIAVWEGEKLTKEKARELSGIQSVFWLQDFENVFKGLMTEAEHVYLNTNEHPRRTPGFETRDLRFIGRCREEYPLHRYERLAPLMRELRVKKSPLELDAIRKACAITGRGFARSLRFIRPGVAECDIEAEYAHEFTRRRARFAYAPIIGSGRNACVLHYVDNSADCRAGELVLMDVGAEYANYASDLTRTVPVSGRFSRRQRAVYNAVLRVLRYASSQLRPGVYLREYEKLVGRAMEQELIGLGLLKAAAVKKQDPKSPLYRKYFMHGTSHYLGLDVHDVGPIGKPLEAGMVLTVEPGLYIPAENLGVRIENTVLVTDTGCEDLMADIPIEAEEIEAAMAGRRSKR
jgi:Xaa-Pro aminopeptidase